jgi:hypothetical protein
MKILSAVAAIIFFAVGATAETTNDLSDAPIQGRNLAKQILEQRPAEGFTNVGVLKIRDAKGKTSEVPIKCEIIISATNWQSTYKAFFTNAMEILSVIHPANQQNRLDGDYPDGGSISGFIDDRIQPLDISWHDYPTPIGSSVVFPDGQMTPFANSDFWVADLSLEFFHWPEQKILKKENRRSRGCNVLESTNPNPSANGYSRVVSWIDEESGGIVHAEAYDAQNKLLKEFDPKSFKKVNGQWELQEMEIRNVQTSSRSRIEFDLKQE